MEGTKFDNREYKIFILFIFYCINIKICISIYYKKLGQNFKFKVKTTGHIAGISTSVPELLTIVASSIKGLFRSKYI